MKRLFQWAINLAVIWMFVVWWAWPFIYNHLPYDDETIPDEIIAFDNEIAELLQSLDSNFNDLYENRQVEGLLELQYFDAPPLPYSDNENYYRNVGSIVYITSEHRNGWMYFGSGSILTEDGVIMTNYHLIEDSNKVVVTTMLGEHYPVTKVLASDELLDIAFIKIDAKHLSPILIGDSDYAEVGDKTLVIGHAERFLNTLSVGNVAGFRSYESRGMGTSIQITNPISSGNSGGVVLNEYGEVIGIPTWSVEYDHNAVQVQNLNFAVPINEALEVLK